MAVGMCKIVPTEYVISCNFIFPKPFKMLVFSVIKLKIITNKLIEADTENGITTASLIQSLYTGFDINRLQ